MLGALYGDIAGSMYEPGTKYWMEETIPFGYKTFGESCHFTDDSLMTLAVAHALVMSRNSMNIYQKNLIASMLKIGQAFPNVSWGMSFHSWLFEQDDHPIPYHSYGNGAAMRISPVGWVCDTLEETIELSKLTTEISHDHPEGIKGAEAIAVAIFMARMGCSKEEIREKMIEYYPELKDMTYGKYLALCPVRDDSWIACQGSVPPSICAFLESKSLEDAVRKAIEYNNDTDTQACMAGAIAEAYYGITPVEEDVVLSYFPEDLQRICASFRAIQKKRIKR